MQVGVCCPQGEQHQGAAVQVEQHSTYCLLAQVSCIWEATGHFHGHIKEAKASTELKIASIHALTLAQSCTFELHNATLWLARAEHTDTRGTSQNYAQYHDGRDEDVYFVCDMMLAMECGWWHSKSDPLRLFAISNWIRSMRSLLDITVALYTCTAPPGNRPHVDNGLQTVSKVHRVIGIWTSAQWNKGPMGAAEKNQHTASLIMVVFHWISPFVECALQLSPHAATTK